MDILFFSTFKKMQLSEFALHPCNGDLVSFSGERVNARSYIWLTTTFGTEPKSKLIDVQYLVIDCPTPYHMIIGQPSLNTLDTIVSMPHLTLKFPISKTEVATIHADQKKARLYYNEYLK